MREPLRSERGLIGKTLVFFLLFVAVAGIAIYDGSVIFLAKVSVTDAAQQAALDGAGAFRGTHDINQAEQTAAVDAQQAGARLTQFQVDPKTGTVTVTLVKKANTTVVQRFGFSKQWGVIRASDTSGPPTA